MCSSDLTGTRINRLPMIRSHRKVFVVDGKRFLVHEGILLATIFFNVQSKNSLALIGLDGDLCLEALLFRIKHVVRQDIAISCQCDLTKAGPGNPNVQKQGEKNLAHDELLCRLRILLDEVVFLQFIHIGLDIGVIASCCSKVHTRLMWFMVESDGKRIIVCGMISRKL